MKGLSQTLIALVLATMLAAAAATETEVTVSGQVRVREEIRKTDFDKTTTDRTITLLRSRIGIEAVVDSNTHAFVQFQDSRRMGDMDQFGNYSSGTLADGKNVDVHQAYILVDRFWHDKLGFKAGRYEFTMGNQRVFGSVGWNNVGRAWDGSLLSLNLENVKLTLFSMYKAQRDNEFYDADFNILGLLVNIKKARLDLFGFFEHDGDTTGNFTNINNLDRFNVGAFWAFEKSGFDFEGNAVYQGGRMSPGPYDPITEANTEKLDVSAFMIQAEAGYSFESSLNARVALGLDYYTGDDDDTDDKFKAYQNSYYTGHKFLGYMDYFANVAGKPYETAGLMDIVLRGQMEPSSGWVAGLDIHVFKTAADYVYVPETGNPENTSDVGIELDVRVQTNTVRGVHLEGGLSMFFQKDAFAGTDNGEPGYFCYSQARVDF